MSNKISMITAVSTMSCLLLWSALTRAEETGEKKWYFSPMLTYVIADSDRSADDGVGVRLGVGTKLNKQWNTELNLLFNDLDFKSGAGKYKQQSIAIDGLYFFDRASSIQAFGLLGAGVINTKVPGNSSSNPLLNAGIGLQRKLSDSGLKIRADVRYRVDMDDTTVIGEDRFSDWLLSLGVSIPFGASTDSAKVASNIEPTPMTTASTINVDSDFDGVPNEIDNCPESAVGENVDKNGCSKLLDSDNDGIFDIADRCPKTSTNIKVNESGCEFDNDGDGIFDSNDNCKDTLSGKAVDMHGCEVKNVIVLKDVYFQTESSKLTSEAESILNDIGATLSKNNDLIIEIAGHTDDRGENQYNLGLSKSRAISVQEHLKKLGVNPTILQTKGYGESNPIAANNSRDGRAKNRRVELHIKN